MAAVHVALVRIGAPRGRAELAGLSGFQVWAAYLLLDAWVAGRDRHHENWAVIRDRSHRWLAPSFDHGNAVGFQVQQAEAEALSRDKGRLRAWAAKGKRHHFADRPALVRLADQALDLAGEVARSRWMMALADVDTATVQAVVHAVPGELMSESARSFCLALLDLNRRRLLDGD